MKKLIFLFIIYSTGVFAQCPTTPILIITQAEIDAFAATYPGCTQLLNDLEVNAVDATNLDGLLQLESSSVDSNIYIKNTLITDASGLDNLTTVGGNLEFEENQLMLSFNGLQQLESIHTDFMVFGNGLLPSLTGLSGLESIGGTLRVQANSNLGDLTGMDNLSTVGIEGVNSAGARGLDFRGNFSLASFAGLENLTEINGAVIIAGNENLPNLVGLENITHIANTLRIYDHNNLLSLEGLSGLQSVGFTLRIQENDQLQNLDGLENLQEFTSNLSITFNPILNSISGLSNVSSASEIHAVFIKNNPNLSFCAIDLVCEGIIDSETVVEIEDNASGCNTVSQVASDCGLAVSDNNLRTTITLYPNPVSDKLQVQITEGIDFQRATVYSILGEKLFFTSEENVDCSQLSSGIYFVKVTTGLGSVTKKIVKE